MAAAGQEAIDEWGGGLIATGGDLNGDKCAYTIHYQVPDGKGGWIYPEQKKAQQQKKDEEEPLLEELPASDIEIRVPQASADAVLIKRLGTDEAVIKSKTGPRCALDFAPRCLLDTGLNK